MSPQSDDAPAVSARSADTLPPPPGEASASPEQAPALSPEAESLARIRNILFGQQVETFEHRFAAADAATAARFDALDARGDAFDARLGTLRDDTTARFHALQAAHTADADALRTALAEAEQRRSDAHATLADDLAAARAAHEAALAEAVGTQQVALAESIADARARDDAQREATAALSATVERLAATVERLTADLARDKADRSLLADLFDHAAARLRAD